MFTAPAFVGSMTIGTVNFVPGAIATAPLFPALILTVCETAAANGTSAIPTDTVRRQTRSSAVRLKQSRNGRGPGVPSASQPRRRNSARGEQRGGNERREPSSATSGGRGQLENERRKYGLSQIRRLKQTRPQSSQQRALRCRSVAVRVNRCLNYTDGATS
jgi:hypothetical protein